MAPFPVCIFVADKPNVATVFQDRYDPLNFCFGCVATLDSLAVSSLEIQLFDGFVMTDLIGTLLEFCKRVWCWSESRSVLVDMVLNPVHGFRNDSENEIFILRIDVIVLKGGVIRIPNSSSLGVLLTVIRI